VKKIPVVKEHFRRTSKGKRVWVKRHWRRKKTRTKIPVRTNNPTVKVTSAEYDPVSKSTNIAIVDEDDDKINFYMQDIPMKVDKVVVDEQGNLGLIVQSKAKKKELTTVHIEQPKDF